MTALRACAAQHSLFDSAALVWGCIGFGLVGVAIGLIGIVVMWRDQRRPMPDVLGIGAPVLADMFKGAR